jgi:hypothetical protein
MDVRNAEWRKSSHSGGNNECVELAFVGGVGAIRDSKNPDGPVLVADVGSLIAAIKAGRITG